MPKLLELPTEILQHVISNYYREKRYDSGPGTLLALCRTCHRLRDIAQPELFRTFGTDGSRWLFNPATNLPGRKLMLFLQTLGQRPDLRKSVKEIRHLYRPWPTYEPNVVPYDIDLGALKKELLISGGSGLKIVQDVQAWKPVPGVKFYPHVSCLLLLVPQLEVLRLKVFGEPQIKSLRHLGNANLAANLQRLRDVKIEFSETRISNRNMFKLNLMAWLFRLPCLKVLELGNAMLEPWVGEDLWQNVDNGRPDLRFETDELVIEKLNLMNVVVTNAAAASLIQGCRRLTHFTCIATAEEDNMREELDVRMWHQALSKHREWLEELNLLDGITERWILEIGDIQDRIWPSFRDFQKLTALQLDHNRTTSRCLPECLESLRLENSQDTNSGMSLNDMRDVQESCPDLTELHLTLKSSSHRVWDALDKYGFKWQDGTDEVRKFLEVDFDWVAYMEN